MGKIVITEFVSLDGVVEDPAGVGDFRHAGCGELSDKKPLRLLHTRTVGDGVVLNNYEPVRDPAQGERSGTARAAYQR